MTEPNIEPPEPTLEDALQLIVKAGLSTIPGIGGIASEVFNALIAPPIEQRKQDWCLNVAQTLVLLRERVTRLEELSNNDCFVDAVFQASRIAIANNEKEKIEALKNALFNVGVSVNPDRALQQIYFGYIDTFSGLHLKILKFIKTLPESFVPSMNEMAPGSAFKIFLDDNIPELKNRNDVRDVIWAELYSKKLVTLESIVQGRLLITPHGKNFLSFIEKS